MAEGPGLDSNYIKVEAVEGEDPDLESGGYYFPRENFSNQFLYFKLKMIVKWFQNFLKMVYLFSILNNIYSTALQFSKLVTENLIKINSNVNEIRQYFLTGIDRDLTPLDNSNNSTEHRIFLDTTTLQHMFIMGQDE